MSVSEPRVFELRTSLTFPALRAEQLESFAARLARAIYSVSAEYPTVVAYFAAPDAESGNIAVGLRFQGADPQYIEDMAGDVLEEALDVVAREDGTEPLEVEREESALVLA